MKVKRMIRALLCCALLLTLPFTVALAGVDAPIRTNMDPALAGSQPVLTGTAALIGTVEITGMLKYGERLTAVLSDSNNTGMLSYQWKRNGISGVTNIGTNSSAYTLVEADIGRIIICEITSSVQTDCVWDTTDGLIAKVDGPDAPTGLRGIAPTFEGSADGIIIGLDSTVLYEYTPTLDDPDSWIKVGAGSTEITGLTGYGYYVRVQGTATREPSDFELVYMLAPQPLDAPIDPIWSGSTPGSTAWNAVDGASGYKVQLYKNGTEDANKVGEEVSASVTGTDLEALIVSNGTGTYYFKVKAVDDSGLYCDSDWAISRNERKYTAPFAPKVTAQLKSRSVAVGQAVTFFVSAQGNPGPSYQWQISTDHGATWQDIPGETNSNYYIAEAKLSQNGYQYHYIVSNGISPDATSNPATLTVLKYIQVGTLRLPDGKYTTDGQTVAAATPTDHYAYFSTANGVQTLTLKNFTYSGPVEDDNKGVIMAGSDLTLALNGESFVTGESTEASAIVVMDGSLTVIGDGVLNAKGGPRGNGVYVQGDMTMNGGTLIAAAGDALSTDSRNGALCGGKLVVNSGELRGIGPGGNPLFSTGVTVVGDVAINGGKLVGEGRNAGLNSRGISSEEGRIAIVRGAVEATAGDASTTSIAISCAGISIDGGAVTAVSGDTDGVGSQSSAIDSFLAPVSITNGTVTATAGNGTGENSLSTAIFAVDASITIEGGTVNATAGNANGQGGYSKGIYCAGGEVSVSGGTVTAKSGTAIDSVAISNWVDNPPDLSSYAACYATASVNANASPLAAYDPDVNSTYKYFRAEPGCAVSGTVTDGDTGAGLAGASVQLKRGTANVGGAAITDASGAYSLGAPAGTGYTVEASMDGYLTGTTAPFDWAAAGVTGKDLTLTRMTTIAAPSFSPAAGTYAAAQSVTLSCTETGAAIRYTMDGSDPTDTSPVFSAGTPINVSATATIRAKAFKDGMIASEIASAAYVIEPLTSITFTLQPQDMTVTFGHISGSLTAAAGVSPSAAAALAWYACNASGAISEPSLYTGGTFAIPANLVPGDYYYLCRATYPGAAAKDSGVAKVRVAPAIPLSIGISPSSTIRQNSADETILTVGEGVSGFGIGNFDTIKGAQIRFENGLFIKLTLGSQCDVTTGSIKVALHKAYLNTLAAGKYTLRVYLTGAGYPPYVETNLTVVKDAVPPQTGDSAAPGLWLVMCLLGVAGLLAVSGKRRRNR